MANLYKHWSENGIGLPEARRRGVALARAVYSKAKFLLLDDPLSALDHQTADFNRAQTACELH